MAWCSFAFIVVDSWCQQRKALVSSLQGKSSIILLYATLFTFYINIDYLMEVSIIAVHDHPHTMTHHIIWDCFQAGPLLLEFLWVHW